MVLDLSRSVLEGRRSISSNRSSSQSRNIFSFGSRPVHQFVRRTHICLQQQIIIAKYKHFHLWFWTCPEVSLKDGDPSAATDHHRKVETVSLSVLHLSINLFEGRTSVCSNRSSSQSINIFTFGSGPVPKCP